MRKYFDFLEGAEPHFIEKSGGSQAKKSYFSADVNQNRFSLHFKTLREKGARATPRAPKVQLWPGAKLLTAFQKKKTYYLPFRPQDPPNFNNI